jgi:hypothetical protein
MQTSIMPLVAALDHKWLGKHLIMLKGDDVTMASRLTHAREILWLPLAAAKIVHNRPEKDA